MDKIIEALVQAAEEATARAAAHDAARPKAGRLGLGSTDATMAGARVLKSLKAQEFAAWLEAAEIVQDACDAKQVGVFSALHRDRVDLLQMAYVAYDPLSETGNRTGVTVQYLKDFVAGYLAGEYTKVVA